MHRVIRRISRRQRTLVCGVALAAALLTISASGASGGAPTALFHKVVVGGLPARAAVNSGLGRAYVSHPDGNSLSIVDLPSRQVVTTVALPFASPGGVAVNPTTGIVYVAHDNAAPGGISVVDGSTGVVLRTLAEGDRVNDVGIDNVNQRLYALVSDFGGFWKLQVFDLAAAGDPRVNNWDAPGATWRLAVAGGGYVWALDTRGTVYKIDGFNGTVQATIPTGTSCCAANDGLGYGIAIDKIHHLVYATRQAGVYQGLGILTVINEDDRYPHDILAELTLGDDPTYIGVDEANARVYVSHLDVTINNPVGNSVSVVQAAPTVTPANPGGVWGCCGTDPPVISLTEVNQLNGAVFPGTPVFDPALNLLVVPALPVQYGSPLGGSLVMFSDPTDDADADGVPDVIDGDGGTGTQPNSILDWTGEAPRPLTRISVDPAGLTLTYTDGVDPKGVRIAASGSGGPALITVCGQEWEMLPGQAATFTCNSVQVEDVTGPGTLRGTSPSGNVSVGLQAGEAVELDETPDGSFSLTNVVGSITTTVSGVTTEVTGPVSGSWAWTFVGFSQPVDNNGVVNVAKAGTGIPLKWRLLDVNGQPVTTLTSANVKVKAIHRTCDLGTTTDLIEETATGASGLQNLGGGYYQYNWNTPKSYAKSCKTLQLDLGEGFTHNAEFNFTK